MRRTEEKKINIEVKDKNGDILPLWKCPFCGGDLEEIDKVECSSLDIYKQCLSCGKIFKEVYVIESIRVEQ